MKLLLALLATTLLAMQQTKTPATPAVRNASLPWVSPDGSHIAFTSNRSGNDDLFVIGSDGSREVQLTNTPDREGMAGWTPDSKHIVFSVFNDGSSTLHEIDLEGKTKRQIAVVAGRSVALSPDGKQVVYWSGD